jgi:type IV pilus assembly protein PilQ
MKLKIFISTILIGACCMVNATLTLGQNRLPVREYTNPDEVVTLDRSMSFSRALDVINQFAQDYAGKIIIDRTETDGNIGISIPPMHWRDALDLMLEAKYLRLIEQRDFFEIVPTQSAGPVNSQQVAALPDTGLSIDSKEVRINAIFFEGNRRALQEIGVDWSTITENVPDNLSQFVNPQQGGGSGGGGGGGGGGQGGGSQGQLPDVNNFDGPFVSVNNKGAQSVSQNVFSSVLNFGEVFGSGISVQALFSAFEADNLGEILASPSVKVLEGQTGSIQVGQDFSIKQRDFAGNVTDEFFSVGTILNVTPRVIDRSDTTFVHLNIEAERSSAQPDPVSTIINKQNANTQALLLDNEATVIAGLYRTEASEVRRGVPILKDLPGWFFGLRYIFGYNSKDYQTRELVILIQASIEPGIEERMRQKTLPGKFDVLEEERQRMQDDIKRYRDIGSDGVAPVRGQDDSNELKEEQEEMPDTAGYGNARVESDDTQMSGEQSTEQQSTFRNRQAKTASENESVERKMDASRILLGTDVEAEQAAQMPDAEDHGRMDKSVSEKSANGIVQREWDSSNKIRNEKPKPENEEVGELGNNPATEETVYKNRSGKEGDESIEESAEEADKERPKAKYYPVNGSETTYKFYVVANSFFDKANAEAYFNTLSGLDYEPQLLKKENSVRYIVAYSASDSWRASKSLYDTMRSGENESVWIYQHR